MNKIYKPLISLIILLIGGVFFLNEHNKQNDLESISKPITSYYDVGTIKVREIKIYVPYVKEVKIPIEVKKENEYKGYNITDVTQPSEIDELSLRRYLDKYPELTPISPTLVENDNRVNAIFMLALIRLESGNGKNCVRQNNLGSVKCFYSGEFKEYDSMSESAEELIELIFNQYISRDGMWYNGLRISDINKCYNPKDSNWSNQIIDIMEEIHFDILEINN